MCHRAWRSIDFVVYAIDADLNLKEGLTASELRAAIDGHVIGEGALTGRSDSRS
jgi:phosphatidylethanolamine-binding protein (PEBP) family uncharacterized protein